MMNNVAQLSLENLKPVFKIDKPIRLIELFAGIGAQAKALEKLGADFEHYKICEFNKYAVKSYNAIHGTKFKPSDITKLTAADLSITDTNKYCYIMTYSFPCQDLSLAGKQKGMKKGSGTRSGLLWEVERLLNECEQLPQVLLMENVTQVHGSGNTDYFTEWQTFLESKGYSNFTADLNAKNYGVPQNRNRCFMISLLGDYSYSFPLPVTLEKRLKDVLEQNVDEKYYLSKTAIKGLIKHNKHHTEKGTGFIFKPKDAENDIANCLRANSSLSATDNTIIQVLNICNNQNRPNANEGRVYDTNGISPAIIKSNGGNCVPKIIQKLQLYPNSSNPQGGRVYDSDGICCALDTSQGGNRMPKVIEPYCSIDINYPQSETRGGRVLNDMAHTIGCQNNSQVVCEPFIVASKGRNPNNPKDRRSGIPTEQMLEANTSGTSNCLTTVLKDNLVVEIDGVKCTIRRLTPLECFRLMTFDDTDYEKVKAAGISKTQMYMQAGNSIVVDVLAEIFKQML